LRHREIHHPPESASIMLLVRTLATVIQVCAGMDLSSISLVLFDFFPRFTHCYVFTKSCIGWL
jgi:hypothetical protein